jgi:hypothetical protein
VKSIFLAMTPPFFAPPSLSAGRAARLDRLVDRANENPPFPAGIAVGAPRFELGTSSPPD